MSTIAIDSKLRKILIRYSVPKVPTSNLRAMINVYLEVLKHRML